MNHDELPSDSDSSDEDYKPAGIDNELSEEESENGSAEDPGSGTELTNENRKKRRKSTNGKIRKKLKKGRPKIDEEDDKQKEEEKENSETSVSEEDKKKKSDQLWEDFLSDCPPPKKCLDSPLSRPASLTDPPTEAPPKLPTKPSPTDQPSKLNQLLTFVGEKVVVDKPTVEVGEPSSPLVTPGGQSRGRGRGRGGSSSGGLSSILGQLGKKGRLSTLEKSKLDWDSFKRDEGINEDLHSHNKGKNGYLEKQDFLERTDLRQFELEKSLRASRRPLNR